MTLCHPMDWACQASLSFTISQSLLKLMPIKSVMPSNHLVLCRALLLLPSVFPSNGIFSNESTLHIRWPNYWNVSFSTSPSNEYSRLIPLGLIGLISLQSKGPSRVFSSTTSQKHNSSVLSLLYGPTLTTIHDYGKNNSFHYINFVTKWCIWFLIYCLGVSQLFFQGANVF